MKKQNTATILKTLKNNKLSPEHRTEVALKACSKTHAEYLTCYKDKVAYVRVHYMEDPRSKNWMAKKLGVHSMSAFIRDAVAEKIDRSK